MVEGVRRTTLLRGEEAAVELPTSDLDTTVETCEGVERPERERKERGVACSDTETRGVPADEDDIGVDEPTESNEPTELRVRREREDDMLETRGVEANDTKSWSGPCGTGELPEEMKER